MAEIVKPTWPSRRDGEPYPFLASAMIDPDTLRHCCIEEATVTAVNSRQTVTVSYSGGTAENVPVWVHTDVGTRRLRLFGEEADDPQEYFKDAGLMFPFPPGSTSALYDPKVLIVVHTHPRTQERKVLCVCHVLQSVDRKFPDDGPPRTYKIYMKFAIGYQSINSPSNWLDSKFFLYDLVDDKIAMIPSYSGTTPVLPVIEASGLSTEAEITDFVTQPGCFSFSGKFQPTYTSVTTWGCYSAVASGFPNHDETSCRPEGGDVIRPGWVGDTSSLECTCYGAVAWASTSPGSAFEVWEINPVCLGGEDVIGVVTSSANNAEEDYAFHMSTGRITYDNGLTIEKHTSYSFHTHEYNGTYIDYTLSVSLSHDGYTKNRSLHFNGPPYEYEGYEVKSILFKATTPTNSICNFWIYDYILGIAALEDDGRTIYSGPVFADHSDLGFFEQDCAVKSSQVFQYMADTFVDLLSTGGIYWRPISSALRTNIRQMGFFVVPYDVRIDLLQAEET